MNVNKDFVKLIVMCFIAGALIGDGIAWILSLDNGAGSLVAPEFANDVGEPLAILIQTVLCGLMGVFGLAGSKVYGSERFNILQATSLHAVMIIPLVMITCYICCWTGRSVKSTLVFGGVMVMMYIIIWITMYISCRAQVKQINEMLEKRRNEGQ